MDGVVWRKTIGCGHGWIKANFRKKTTKLGVSPCKVKVTPTATPNTRKTRLDSNCDENRCGSSVCETYIADVWPVASVGSQNAVQHIVIRAALHQEQRHSLKKDSTSLCNSEAERLSLTFWKMHRLGKVREMSSLICSRLDSRSEESASRMHQASENEQAGESRGEAIASVSKQTFRFRLRRGRRQVPPLFFSSCQTDVVEFCLGHSAEDSERL